MSDTPEPDTRPRCPAIGPRIKGREHQGPVPCELEAGHLGQHVWDGVPGTKGVASVWWRGDDESARVVKR